MVREDQLFLCQSPLILLVMHYHTFSDDSAKIEDV